ncbi:MAG: hypothetical protein PHC51_02855 [bacterium]|nr:hypothetical protein [bacterium]
MKTTNNSTALQTRLDLMWAVINEGPQGARREAGEISTFSRFPMMSRESFLEAIGSEENVRINLGHLRPEYDLWDRREYRGVQDRDGRKFAAAAHAVFASAFGDELAWDNVMREMRQANGYLPVMAIAVGMAAVFAFESARFDRSAYQLAASRVIKAVVELNEASHWLLRKSAGMIAAVMPHEVQDVLNTTNFELLAA